MLVTLLRGGLNGDNENRAKTGKSFIIILESCTFWQYSACAHGNITDAVELCKIPFSNLCSLVLAFHEMSKIPSNCTRFSFGSHARPHKSFFSFTTSPLFMLGIKIHVCRCGFCNKDRNCVTYVGVAFYLIEHLHCSILHEIICVWTS